MTLLVMHLSIELSAKKLLPMVSGKQGHTYTALPCHLDRCRASMHFPLYTSTSYPLKMSLSSPPPSNTCYMMQECLNSSWAANREYSNLFWKDMVPLHPFVIDTCPFTACRPMKTILRVRIHNYETSPSLLLVFTYKVAIYDSNFKVWNGIMGDTGVSTTPEYVVNKLTIIASPKL